jgi:molybdate transport system substrate-binding protein
MVERQMKAVAADRARVLLLTAGPVALAAVALAGAGSAAGLAASPSSSSPRLTILAASSLTDVFPAIDPRERFSFGGSNELAVQIRYGAPADVYATAKSSIAAKLHRAHLVESPVHFARNSLVVVVPRSNPAHVHNIYDVAKPGVSVVVAQTGVPVGDYTLHALLRLKLKRRILANVVSRTHDVRAVLEKVALGQADVGFVYATDARASARTTAIPLPAIAQPSVSYALAVVTTSRHKSAARAFIRAVLGKRGERTLRAYGFSTAKHPGGGNRQAR